jgi:hypothetical protein
VWDSLQGEHVRRRTNCLPLQMFARRRICVWPDRYKSRALRYDNTRRQLLQRFRQPGGCGTVFDLSTSGKESVLYSFKGIPDGDEPLSLLAVKGRLYGATAFGGSGKCVYGCGTFFKVRP